MSASRCRCKPRRATYPTLKSDLQGSSRSTMKFQAHASGGLKALLCVVTTSGMRSEEHTSELQSRPHLVCRLLLEKKKKKISSIVRRQSINNSDDDGRKCSDTIT